MKIQRRNTMNITLTDEICEAEMKAKETAEADKGESQ